MTLIYYSTNHGHRLLQYYSTIKVIEWVKVQLFLPGNYCYSRFFEKSEVVQVFDYSSGILSGYRFECSSSAVWIKRTNISNFCSFFWIKFFVAITKMNHMVISKNSYCPYISYFIFFYVPLFQSICTQHYRRDKTDERK